MYIHRFIKIGFKFTTSNYIRRGWVREYEYFPSNLGNNHYTLVTFTYGEIDRLNNKTEYRLYILNEEDEFVDSIFQCCYENNVDFLNESFDELFKSELLIKHRDDSINKLLT